MSSSDTADGVSTPMSVMSRVNCVAVCCSVLQCVAVCCSVFQCVAVCCSMLQCKMVGHSRWDGHSHVRDK